MAHAGDDLFLLGDDFESILGLNEDETLLKLYPTLANEVSAKYRHIHPYLVCFQKNITELHATVLSRQQ